MKKTIFTALIVWLGTLFSFVNAATYVSKITSGKYYRIHSFYDGLSMDGSGSLVASTTTNTVNYAQLWQISSSGSNYTLKNLFTDEFIQAYPQYGTASIQWTTGSTAKAFKIYTKSVDGSTMFSFSDSYSGWYGLHTAATQSYKVVGWDYAADASYWYLEEVTLTSSELAEIENLKLSVTKDYTSQLSTFFDNSACTVLKSTYQSMSDSDLRSAMNALPAAIQEMAVRVKNNKWNSNSTWNKYEKDFRIHAYDIFSNSDLWDDITKTGPFAHLFHPTGIQAVSGDLIYIFVDSDLKDSDASLQVELVNGIDRRGTSYTLKKGYNAIYVTGECELFVSYLLNNTAKSCNDYPDITVHIEGGTCNGCFDMRGHGHTNSDWEWMKKNMFKGTYLHVKGNSTILNCYRERVIDSSNAQNVEGIMNVFDFVFDNLQSLAGCDQWKKDGRYKMMTNNYDNTSGNPFWSTGAYGYAQPGIWYNGLFNYDNLKNVGTDGGHIWVIEHELGHGHQTPINLSGQTESSNNSMAQCVNFLTTQSARGKEIFTTTRSSRGAGVKGMIDRFNQTGSYSWIDYGGMRTKSGDYDDTWLSNRWLFQLWLYFDGMRNYKPETNTGFSFMSDLFDAMRKDPIVKSTNANNPKLATDDYLKLAKKCSELTQTDLSEFFEAWGFWKLTPSVANENDVSTKSTWFFGDYSNTYIKTAQSQVNEVKTAMKAYSKKADNLMFIEDRCIGSTLPTYNNASVKSFGETGYYESYNKTISGSYKVSLIGNTVSISGGTGAVGFKVYDSDGNLVALSNTPTFAVSDAIATGLGNGTYTIKVAQGVSESIEAPIAENKSVTFNVYLDGELLATTSGMASIGCAPQLPEGMNNTDLFGEWMSYTFTPATVSQSTTEINVNIKWDGPFPLSTKYSSAKWFYLQLKGNYYPTYVAGGSPNVTLPATNAKSNTTKWAFIGNPLTGDGLTLVNKAAGSSMKLVSANPSSDGNTGGNTYATLATSGTYTKWIPKVSTYKEDGFYLFSENGYALNQRSTSNLAYWTSGYDLGSTFVAIEDVDNYLPGITDLANLKNDKAYVITNARATWTTTGADATALSATKAFSRGENSQFAIIKHNGKYYLYSLKTKKFLNSNNTFSGTAPITPVTITSTGSSNYRWFFSFDSSHNINVNSDNPPQAMIDSWSTKDDGNKNAIIEAADFNPAEALTILGWKLGDVNSDGEISIADVTALVNIILDKDGIDQYDTLAADVNNDGEISIADVTALVNIILEK